MSTSETERNDYCFACRSYCARNAPCRCCHEGGPRCHSTGEDAMAAFERRFPKARHGALTDAAAQYGRTLTIHLLDIADAAMEDENIDRRARRRVINAILYGGSNPADVELRAAQQTRMTEYVSSAPMVFDLADADEREQFLRHINPKGGDDD